MEVFQLMSSLHMGPNFIFKIFYFFPKIVSQNVMLDIFSNIPSPKFIFLFSILFYKIDHMNFLFYKIFMQIFCI